MTRKEAAQTLTKLLAKYEELDKSWGGINDKYYEAVTIACGVLLVDDVLNTNPIPPKGEDNMTDYISREAAREDERGGMK